MSDRENLIDWISDIIDFVDWEHIEEVADHLIANGVVIQKQAEWILVDKKKVMAFVQIVTDLTILTH